jgi:hypothetical protein
METVEPTDANGEKADQEATVASQKTPKQIPKRADKPHHYTVWLGLGAISISVLSLCISFFSVTESRRSRLINELASSPYLEVTSARLGEDWSGDGRISCDVTISNLGKTVADDVHGEAEPGMLFRRNEQDGTNGDATETTAVDWPQAAMLEAKEVPPGMPISRRQSWTLKFMEGAQNSSAAANPLPMHFVGLRITGTYTYFDQLAGVTRSGAWCFMRDTGPQDIVLKGDFFACQSYESRSPNR